MKQKIYILGLFTTSILFIGIMFKKMHLPGAGWLLITGMTVLVLGFLPAALINNYRAQENGENRSLYIITWITCLLIFTSMLFKILHWPGAGILLMISLPFPYVVFLPFFLVVTARNKSFSIYNTVSVLFLLAVMSVVSALLALNVSKDVMADSLKISGNYNRMEQVLDKANLQQADTPVAMKIDEALALLTEYEDLIFRNEGISREQWISDPEIILDRQDWRGIKGRKYLDRKEELRTELQQTLSGIIVMAEKDPSMASLSKVLPSILLMEEQSKEHYIWNDALFNGDVRPWVQIYLDGLRTNLKLIKTTL